MNKPFTPHITEKAYGMISEDSAASSTYTFRIPRTVSKEVVKTTIEKQYKVTVESVRIVNLHGKVRRFKGVMGHTQAIKKALVRLKKGDTIANFLPETAANSENN